jgi:hypothetical protein
VTTPRTTAAIPPPPVAGTIGFLRARVLGVPAVSMKRKTLAFAIAVVADLMQLVLFPFFSGGAASPLDDGLDIVVAVSLLFLLGYSHRLALAFAIELVPGVDLFPTWTAVVASIPARATPR